MSAEHHEEVADDEQEEELSLDPMSAPMSDNLATEAEAPANPNKKAAAAALAAEERKAAMTQAIDSINAAGVPRKVSTTISTVWLDDTKTSVTAALLGSPLDTSIKAVNRLKKLPDEERVKRLASLYCRVALLEEKLVRARLEVVHIEHARIAMAYPEDDHTKRKRKVVVSFVAGDATRAAGRAKACAKACDNSDDDCCNDDDLEEEEEAPAPPPPKKRKRTEKKAVAPAEEA
jgi:hypothetical protein